MRIRFVVIPPDSLTHVKSLVDALRNAVNTGNMDVMDAVTEKLISLTSGEQSMDLSEEDWQGLMAKIRTRNPAFQSDYLLPGRIFSPYFPNVTSDTMILQLLFDSEDGDDV